VTSCRRPIRVVRRSNSGASVPGPGVREDGTSRLPAIQCGGRWGAGNSRPLPADFPRRITPIATRQELSHEATGLWLEHRHEHGCQLRRLATGAGCATRRARRLVVRSACPTRAHQYCRVLDRHLEVGQRTPLPRAALLFRPGIRVPSRSTVTGPGRLARQCPFADWIGGSDADAASVDEVVYGP